MIYEDILQTIGNTPVIRINRMAPPDIDMFVKVEAFNPMASVKDRLAYAVIMDGERRGTLKPGQTVIEATSGNTGVALAMVCATRGYPFVAVMADSFSIERLKVMKLLGAKVVLTPAADRGTGMVKKAEELAARHGWFLARQFDNPANPEYHRMTTAPEILRDFANRRLDYWVTGWGTGGTVTGVAEVLKAARPEVEVVTAEPAVAALLDGQEWTPHKIQGWAPDFVPSVLNADFIDRLVTVDDDAAKATALRMAREEGLFVGVSAGATMAAGLAVARDAEPGSTILVMAPDTGERYLSTYMCEDIDEGSDEALFDDLGAS